jgi:ABC-type transport system involved in multi-copper enzyme maturation permease subunit
MVVAKPISRSTFILGRSLGNLMTVGFLLAVMGGLFLVQLQFAGATTTYSTGIHVEHLTAIYGMFLEVVLLTALCFAFAAASSQFVSSLSVTCLYFIGHMAEDLFNYANRSKFVVLKFLGQLLYYVLPNFDRLDWRGRATYLDPTSANEVLASTGYTLAYATILLLVSTWIFERRDFK